MWDAEPRPLRQPDPADLAMNCRRRIGHRLKLLCGAAYRGAGCKGTGSLCHNPPGRVPMVAALHPGSEEFSQGAKELL
jgi:hypothetical protein